MKIVSWELGGFLHLPPQLNMEHENLGSVAQICPSEISPGITEHFLLPSTNIIHLISGDFWYPYLVMSIYGCCFNCLKTVLAIKKPLD